MLVAYAFLLLAHSWVRWVVVAVGLGLGVASAVGWWARHSWTLGHDRLQRAFVVIVDLQLTLGLLLYASSPITRAFLDDPSGTTSVRELRFFGLEHVTMMLLAVGFAHGGRALVRRREDATSRHRIAALSVVLFAVLVLVAVPWPFGITARPWFRW